MWQIAARALLGTLVLILSGAFAPANAQGLSENEVKAFRERASKFFRDGRYEEALAAAEKWAKAAEKAEGGKPGDATAIALVSLAWYELFAKRASRSLAATERAMALRPDALAIETNRPHAFLFLGRIKEAAEAYRAHKGEALASDTKWEDAILKDFAEFRKHGLADPRLRDMEKALASAPESPEVLHQTSLKLSGAGKYPEAIPFAERYLAAMNARYGENDAKYATAIDNLASLNYDQHSYAEAEPLYRQVLAIREQVLGPNHRLTFVSLNNLGNDLNNLARYQEAEPLLKRAVEGLERISGADDGETLNSVRNLAWLYEKQGRTGEAGPLYRRAFEGYERVLGKDHHSTLKSVDDLAMLYFNEGSYAEAEPFFLRLLEASERTLGKDHADTLTRADNLATVYHRERHYEMAEPLYLRVLQARERTLGKDHPDTLGTVHSLAMLYKGQDRFSDGEALYRRAIDGRERVLGKEHPDTLASVSSLASLYYDQGRYAEAEPLYMLKLEVQERMLGKEHASTLQSLNDLAAMYVGEGRDAEAEPLFKRAYEAKQRVLGEDDPSTLVSLNNLAELYGRVGRGEEAEYLYAVLYGALQRVLKKGIGKDDPTTLSIAVSVGKFFNWYGDPERSQQILERAEANCERALGKEHPLTLSAMRELGRLYQKTGRYEEAGDLFQRALETSERVLGPEHPGTLDSFHLVAGSHYIHDDWRGAAGQWRRSTAIIIERDRRSTQSHGPAFTGKETSGAKLNQLHFWGLLKSLSHLAREDGKPDSPLTREMFQTAQWAENSEAAASLAQMAARGAKDDPELSPLVRERQDLIVEWQRRDGLRNAWLSQPLDKRDAKAEEENKAKLDAIGARIEEIGKVLTARFPDHAALASPTPLTVEDVQALLAPDEALVLFFDTAKVPISPAETLIWVVTRNGFRWVRSELGTWELITEVQALRCGLDAAAWLDDKLCPGESGLQGPAAKYLSGGPLPFDHARAHRLYQQLFGQVEDLIKGKQLLLVPSGPLTQLPFQVLVTAPPASGDNKSVAWLVRDHALTVLPAVSSLKALRRVARPSAAKNPMTGFGNPLLDGNPADPEDRERAQRARTQQRCTGAAWPRTAALAGPRRGLAAVKTRGGLSDVKFLREQEPLPETANELCAVALDMNADPAGIYLGERASERQVKRLSESGELAQYRVVHFATHGAAAGQVEGNAEPGLLLTPPETPSEEDDGYLTASEIAALKLDADWVILSACNTAAGGAQNTEALSGLARAFLYAQARALLVSHWEVNSDATVKLVTGAMSQLGVDKSMGRAEAMRQSMLALIDKGDQQEAHPAFWAPFVVVGEGGSAR